MLKAIKDLFSSKKFLLTLAGTVVVTVMSHLSVPADIITFVAGLFGVNIAGVGLADLGKEKAKIEANK